METDFLFARPSFFSGAARVLDIGGVFSEFNFSRSSEEADFRAILSDWRAVGSDLQRAMESYDPHEGQMELFPDEDHSESD